MIVASKILLLVPALLKYNSHTLPLVNLEYITQWFLVDSELCNQSAQSASEYCITPQRKRVALVISPPTRFLPRHQQPLIYCLQICLFGTSYMNEILYMWHFVTDILLCIIFLCYSMYQYFIFLAYCVSIHSLMDIWVVLTHRRLWIMLLWTLVPLSLRECVPRNGILGSRDNSMFTFLKNCQIASQEGCTIGRSHHLRNEDSVFFISSPRLVIIWLFGWSHSRERVCLGVALNCIPLTTNCTDHFFMHLQTLCMTWVEKCLLLFAHLLNGCLFSIEL